MPVHSGPVTALFLLLVMAGGQKILDPSTTGGALRAAGLPHAGFLVRGLGAFEVGVGVSFVALGGPWPALAGAVLYGGFALFVLNALVRELPISSCGCLGAVETPPTIIHVVVNGLAVVLAASAVIMPVGPLGGVLGEEMGVVLPYLVFVAATVLLLYATLAVLPLVSRRAKRADLAYLPDPASQR